jgi:putative nucleotidyltransferase with HDIG domain
MSRIIIGAYNLNNKIFNTLSQNFKNEQIDVLNNEDIINLELCNLLMAPDILLTDISSIDDFFSKRMLKVIKKKKIIVAVLCNGNISYKGNVTYVLPYDVYESINIADNIIRTIANTKRNEKINELSLQLQKDNYIDSKTGEHDKEEVIEQLKTVLSFIETKDNYTKAHCERVTVYASLIAADIGFSQEKIQKIYEAGLLHDIGKIGIENKILTKTGKLNSEEFNIMKRHVQISTNLLSKELFSDIIPIIEAHHEKYDGTGYPKGLKGENIPLEARILTLADSFDAMTTDRIYNKKKNMIEAVKEIRRCMGTQFDPELSKVFINLLLTNIELRSYFEEITESVSTTKVKIKVKQLRPFLNYGL